MMPPPTLDIEISTTIREGGRPEGVQRSLVDNPLFRMPLFVVVGAALLLAVVVGLVLAWSIYFLSLIGIPFDQICRLWPPGWKCP